MQAVVAMRVTDLQLARRFRDVVRLGTDEVRQTHRLEICLFVGGKTRSGVLFCVVGSTGSSQVGVGVRPAAVGRRRKVEYEHT